MTIPTSLGDAIRMMQAAPDSGEHRMGERYIIEMARRNTMALHDARKASGRYADSHQFVAWLMQRPDGADLRRQYDAEIAAAEGDARGKGVRVYGGGRRR